jgi:hypothetical protein
MYFSSCEWKLYPRFVMIVLGKPMRCRMSQMKLTSRSMEIYLIGLYSIHFVNFSMTTNTWVKPLGAVVKGPIMSRPQQAKGQDGGMVMRLCVGT